MIIVKKINIKGILISIFNKIRVRIYKNRRNYIFINKYNFENNN